MHIIIKKGSHRVDPRHPQSTDPSYASAAETGRQRMAEGRLKFEDKGQEESYWKAVKANPANVPGLPPFAPPLEIKTTMSGINTPEITESAVFRRNLTKLVKDIELFCKTCDKLTRHQISPEQSYCTACGSQKAYRPTTTP